MMCMADYRESESRTGSESSGLTGHESDELAQQDSPRIKSMSSEWTDEKHSLYLKSMEASFVNQLYNSIDILGWPSQKERSVPNFSGEANCSPSCTRQFKVRQHGSWKKIKFGRPESQRSTAKDCRGFLTSPWIQHFTPARKSEGATAPALQECAIRRRAINFNGKKAVLCCPATNSKLSPFGNSFFISS
ncbi:COLD REGULATED PROTEIN 27 [Salix purpurea]|uniref:COLD REGULATED PROTEIN 27 n=1 Tax=Salix purpurea TaxID=77065 RepID=A0A9Q0PDD9_SALPP|nr:COLD REGULATED PROTEIN 27 [Salix purpurea]